jgi:Amt family ammonium transporter
VNLIFVLLWTTLVFDIVGFWQWNENGWLRKMEFIDYGGGTPVHIVAGFSALAYAV